MFVVKPWVSPYLLTPKKKEKKKDSRMFWTMGNNFFDREGCD